MFSYIVNTGVATIKSVLPPMPGSSVPSILVHFDGWSDRFDYHAPIDNEDLHPAGFCITTHRKLEPPKSYGKDFRWSTYLTEQQAETVGELTSEYV